MIEQLPQSSQRILGFKMSGRLHDEDYRKFVPVIDAAVAKQRQTVQVRFNRAGE